MWRLARLDLAYSWRSLSLVYAVAIPAVIAIAYHLELQGYPQDIWGVFACWMAGGAVISDRQKERRERQLALLPVSAGVLALARLLSYAIPAAAGLAVYGGSGNLLGSASFSLRVAEIAMGGLLLLGALFFAIQDAFCWSPARQLKLRSLLTLFVVLIMVQLPLAWIAVVAMTGRGPVAVTTVVDLGRAFLSAPHGPTAFLGLTCLVALLTVYTFERRRSYLQT